MRDELVEVMARAIKPVAWATLDRDGDRAEDQHKRAAEHSLIQATAALDVAIDRLMEPSEEMVYRFAKAVDFQIYSEATRRNVEFGIKDMLATLRSHKP